MGSSGGEETYSNKNLFKFYFNVSTPPDERIRGKQAAVGFFNFWIFKFYMILIFNWTSCIIMKI